MRDVRIFLKKWLPGVTATLLTMFLLYVEKDYPCLTGAGLALADFEAFVLFVLIALPCLGWAVRYLTPVNVFGTGSLGSALDYLSCCCDHYGCNAVCINCNSGDFLLCTIPVAIYAPIDRLIKAGICELVCRYPWGSIR